MRSQSAGLGALLVLGAMAVACNRITGASDLEVVAPVCTPGETRACSGAQGCAGVQVCSPATEAFSSCDCGGSEPLDGSEGTTTSLLPPPPPAGGAGGAGAAGGTGGMPPRGEAGSPNLVLTCTPGDLRACVGPGGCAGTQTCLESGMAHSDCACPPSGVVGSVSAACNVDADCAPGLTCVSEGAASVPFSASVNAMTGGVQNGYCTRSCATNADCQGFDPLAECLSYPGFPGFCLEACNPGEPSFPTQCNGRGDLACQGRADTAGGYCVPICQNDAECGGRFCDLGSGLCVDAPRPGAPMGAACSGDQDCAGGVCATLRGRAVCSGVCNFGSTAGCGYGETAELRDAACLDTITGLPSGLGLCTELCDAAADCELANEGWTCAVPVDIDLALQLALIFGRTGVCAPPSAPAAAGCSDSCLTALDGDCDDGGPNAEFSICSLGTDCTDCGPR